MDTSDKTKEELRKFVDETNERLWHIRGLPDFDVISLGKEVVVSAKQIEYPFGIARALLNSAMGAFIGQNDVDLALRYVNEAMEMFRQQGNKKWIANAHCIMGIIYNTIQNPEPALYNVLRALDFYESNPNENTDKAMVYYVVATIYKDLKKFEEAEKYFRIGSTSADIGTSAWGGRVFAGLANVYMMQEKHEESLKYSLLGLEKMRQENNTIGESRILNDIGVTYKKMKRYTEALQFLQEGLLIRVRDNVRQFAVGSLQEIASLHLEIGNVKLAIEKLQEAEAMAIEIGQMVKLRSIYFELSCVYKTSNDFAQALFYAEKLLELNNDLHKKEIEKRISGLQGNLLKEKEEEIERLKNVELKNAYEVISDKNKEILDSIRYAKRIQLSLLPTEKYIERNLKRLNK